MYILCFVQISQASANTIDLSVSMSLSSSLFQSLASLFKKQTVWPHKELWSKHRKEQNYVTLAQFCLHKVIRNY
ncbi:hypothetical protein K1719_031832 [Acacia pycnantha]|nr:hypothetical protein K1719_031832 [Acacia pycnantha]